MRSPKIKIPQIDLSTFVAENLSIDPFWDDLITKGDKSYKEQDYYDELQFYRPYDNGNFYEPGNIICYCY